MKELVKIVDLQKIFNLYAGPFKVKVGEVRAVDGVSFSIFKGETLGLVGESGCGKTTLASMLLRLVEPTSGRIYFAGDDISKLSGDALKGLRRRMQIVFQDPFGSLNPRLRISEIVGEPVVIHRIGKVREKVEEALKAAGIGSQAIDRYPHEFSGGQRQRIGIARALILKPELLICDEPVSSLDVSIQAQILNLLRRLQADYNLTYLFIAHNLSVVEYMADRVIVMYMGRIVETGKTDEIYSSPLHPYTKLLLASSPKLKKPSYMKERYSGEIPSATEVPEGCIFHTRCPYADKECKEVAPPSIDASPTHHVVCHKIGSKEPDLHI